MPFSTQGFTGRLALLNRVMRPALLAALVLALAITFVAAVLPPRSAPHLLGWDKAQHFVAFYALAILWAAATPRLRLSVIVLSLIGFGAAIELAQALPFVHRDAEFLDLLADTIGVCAALGPMLVAKWRRAIGDGVAPMQAIAEALTAAHRGPAATPAQVAPAHVVPARIVPAHVVPARPHNGTRQP